MAQGRAARSFSDVLRTELPDLDDVTIGRVLLQVGVFIGRASDCNAMDAATNTLLISAIDMTALERDIPSAPSS